MNLGCISPNLIRIFMSSISSLPFNVGKFLITPLTRSDAAGRFVNRRKVQDRTPQMNVEDSRRRLRECIFEQMIEADQLLVVLHQRRHQVLGDELGVAELLHH